MATYYIRIPDPDQARASGTFAFRSQSAPGMAEDLVAHTSLSGDILRHRLRLLAGKAWELRDVRY